MVSILILGGTGETGSWFARYFKDKGFDVAVWGPSGKVEVAERLGVRWRQQNQCSEAGLIQWLCCRVAPRGSSL
ncbi:MAG: hypothetical protein NTU95_07500 [Methanothrix sp.]|nr:hypothetical protein [Methanothrix sp.]